MKVLVVESTVFGFDGITNVITNYYTHLDHSKVHMDFVTINPVSKQFMDTLKIYGSKNFVLPYRNNNPFRYLLRLSKVLKSGNYAILHVHGCSATMAIEMLAAKLAGVKVRIAHSHNTNCDHVKIDRFLRPFFYRWCNCGFACGQEAGEWMFPNRKFEIISNGIDLEKFQFDSKVRTEMREKNNLNDKLVVGHVGRFSQQKNHVKLIEIFEEFSKNNTNSCLVLIGDGELRSTIEERVNKKNLNVLFVGLTDEVDKWLQAIDIIVFPSLFEGLPLGLVEAQAASLPCVLSNTISPMIKITDLVEFVELNAPSTEWCKQINATIYKFDRLMHADAVKVQIRDKHFDITYNCQELVLLYQKLWNQSKGL